MLRKNSFLYTFLAIFFSVLSLSSWARTLYWVNDGGNWNDASHWSVTSGGKGGAGIPGSADDVVFDLNSFSYPYEVINLSGTASCNSFQTLPDVPYIQFVGNSLSKLEVHGSFDLQGLIDWQYTGTVHFTSAQAGNKIAAKWGNFKGGVCFDGSGSWELSNMLYAAAISISSGNINVNGFEIACDNLKIEGYQNKKLDLSGGILYIGKQLVQVNSGNFNLNSTSGKLYYQHFPASGLSNIRPTHRVASVDSTQYTQTNCTCNHNDSGTTCNGTITITKIYASDLGGFSYQWNTGSTTSSISNLCAGTYTYQIYDSADGSLSTPTSVTITEPSRLSITYTIRQPRCFGECNGWIRYCLGGDNAPYTFGWYGGGPTGSSTGCPSYLYDSSLCIGKYQIHVADSKGCHNTLAPINIKGPAQIILTITGTPPKCNAGCDGTATVTASGGHVGTTYTYKWNTIPVQTTQTATNLCAGINYVVTVKDDSGCTAKDSITLSQPPPVTISTSQTNVSCNGSCDGSANATGGGGTSPYTYSWSTGATTTNINNLCAGVYKIVVTDANGCKDSANVTITQPAPLTITLKALPNPLKCNGDCNATVTATIGGGTAPYTYKWNGLPGGASIVNQCAGVYKCVVTDAHGCKDSATITITQPTAITTTVTAQIPPTCNGSCNGSIKVTVSGGTPAYTYKWSPTGQTTTSINGLCAGTYTLVVTDKNGCTDTTKVTLANPPPLTITINATNVSCNGACDGKGVATVSGGTSPYTYKWNNNPAGTTDSLTGLCSGNDSVTVTDANGCTSTAYFSITQPNPLVITVSSNNSACSLCNGSASISVSGGTAPYSYSWTTGSTTDSATGLCKGTYTVTVTDANNCTATQKITIVPVVKIIITSSGSNVTCNGSCDGQATANASGGTSPYVYSWTNGETTATDTALCAGNYTVTVTDAAGCTNTDSVTLAQPPPIKDTTTQTNVSCSGACVGVATDSAYGGTPPYKYLWSTGATTSSINGLCVGTYIVTITDANGCTHVDSVVITQQNTIQANPTVTNATCGSSDGAINLAPTGGSGVYTYLWAPGGQTTQNISGIPAGTYTVTITDALGCTKTFIIGVSNTTGPGLGSTPKNVSCFNSCNGYDSVFIATPTTGPYTYLWAPGGQTTTAISNLCPGIYVCQVTDALGCITTQSDTINKPAPINPNWSSTNVTCNGSNDGTISFAPTGGVSPYSYTWAPAVSVTNTASGLGPGIYTITVTDANGCDSVVNITITQPPVLVLTMSQTNVLCNGDCNGTGTVTPSGGTGPYIFFWSNGGRVPSIVFLCPGTYSVTVTDANGCSMLDSVVITEPPALSVSMASTNVSCDLGSDGTATLTVSGGTPGYTYSWSNAATSSSISGLSVGTYTVTATDANGCTITDSVTITQPTAINITMAATNATCNGTCDGTATATVSGGTSPYTYLWSPGGMTTSSVSALCAGTYTVTVTDADGCSKTANITVSQPTPLLANASSTNTLCPSSCDGTASSSPVGGTGPYIYLWSNGATTTNITNLCAGNYTVYVTDANGCTDSAVTTVGSPAPITSSAATAATNCGVCNGSITVTAAGGTGPYTYSWSTGATTSTVTSMCAGVYTYTVTDANSCTATFSVILNSTSGPTSATVKIANDSCFGQCNGFISIVPTGGTAPYQYSFNSGPLQSSDTGLNLCPGTYTIMIQDAAGCEFFDTSSVTQPTALANTGVTTNAACIGKCTGTITLTTSGGTPPYAYSWSNGSGIPNLSNMCPGNYTDTLRDAKGCSLIQTFTVGQNTAITTTDVKTSLLCNGDCNGTATTTASGGSSPYTYLWSNGQTSSSAINLCAGTYVDTVTDKNGCQAWDTVVMVQPTALAVTFAVTPVTCNNSCDGKVVANVSGGTPAYTFSWAPGGTTTDSVINVCPDTMEVISITDANGCKYSDSTMLGNPPVMSAIDFVTNPSCNNSTDGSITFIPSGGVPPYTYSWSNGANTQNLNNIGPGTYIVTLTGSTGCSLIDTIKVAADTNVEAKAGNDTTICATASVTLNGASSISATSYTWYQIPGLTVVGNTAVITVSPAVTTSYLLITTDGLCSDSDTVVVNVNPLPTASAGTAQSIFLLTTTANIGGSPTGPPGSTYSWKPSAGLNDSTAANPVASPTVTTTYTVTVTNSFGCSATDTVTVFVLPQFVIPGGFTPNGDGINDVWTINNIDLFPNVVVEVYNRWGEQLFYSNGYKTPWDGNYKGAPLPVGTYYYVINLNDSRFPNAYTGPVTIMR